MRVVLAPARIGRQADRCDEGTIVDVQVEGGHITSDHWRQRVATPTKAAASAATRRSCALAAHAGPYVTIKAGARAT
eukprot:2637025-Prymnesium_polylepis.1